MSPASCIITGLRGTFQLALPEPRFTFNRTDVDEFDDSWHSDRLDNPDLTEGCRHPKHPGLILDVATPTMEVPEFDGQPGSYTFQCKWIGDARGKSPTKFISRSKTRTIGIGFDQFVERFISWNAEPMAITGTASTNRINHPGNTFSDGERIAFPQIGSSVLHGGNSLQLPSVYFVINRTADDYQVAATLGGSAIALVSDITSGYVMDARFCPGTRHPTWANMYVSATTTNDNYTNWRTVDVTYTGMQFGKPLHTVTTCNGAVWSSSTPIAWDFPDGWTDELNSNVQMPEVGCTETELTTSTLDSAQVPSSGSESSGPTNAPAIRSVFISLDEEKIVHNWPSGWSQLDKSHVETINSQINVSIQKTGWRYCWPISIK